MKNQEPVTLTLLTILSLALAAWMILYGLQLRFFGNFIRLAGVLAFFTPPHNLVTWVGWMNAGGAAGDLGWPLLVVGSSLLGSISGLWLRQSWAPRSLQIFSAASLITLHWMNVLSILLLVLAGNKVIRRWITADPDIHG